MNEQAMSQALDAIHDEAVKLLEHELPDEVQSGIELIISLARYKHDVRGRAAAVAHEETYERDGIDYRIIVEQDEGAYWGKWECTACGHKGVGSSKRCTSVEDAVEAGISNIGPHPMFCKAKSGQ